MENLPRQLQRLQQYQDELTWTLGDNEDCIIARTGLIATFFYERGSAVEVRAKIVECFDYFYQYFGQHIKGKYYIGGKFTKMTATAYQNWRKKALDITDPNGILSWIISSESTQDTAPTFFMSALTAQEAREVFDEKSHLKFALPYNILFTKEGINSYRNLVRFICEKLKPVTGYGGLSPVLPYDRFRYMPIEHDLAQRFIGLDVDSMSFCSGSFALKHHIKVANWYTILGEKFIQQLGGEASLRQQLAAWPDIVVHGYEGGLIIQAGEYPDLGAPEDGPPQPYVVVNHVVKPIRAPEPGSLHTHMPDNNGFDRPSTANWYARFDQVPLQMSQEKTEPKVLDQARCEANQPCPQAGYWWTPARENSRRRFTEGEIMPDYPDSKYGSTIWYWDQQQAE